MEEYTQGFDVTQNLQYQAHQCVIDAYEMGLENGIEQGRNEAWEVARKIQLMSPKDLNELFHYGDLERISVNFSAPEAIEKIRAWEEKKAMDDKVKVGDELESGDTRYIVVRVYNYTFEGIGACGVDTGLCLNNFHKIGRHFDSIAEVLEKMKNGE